MSSPAEDLACARLVAAVARADALTEAEAICRRVAADDERLTGRKDSAALACANRIAQLRRSR